MEEFIKKVVLPSSNYVTDESGALIKLDISHYLKSLKEDFSKYLKGFKEGIVEHLTFDKGPAMGLNDYISNFQPGVNIALDGTDISFTVYLADSKMVDLTEMASYSDSLETLDLSDNNLDAVKGLTKLNNLRQLNLSDNGLASLEKIDLPNNLKRLVLRNNQIKTIESIAYSGGLEELDLAFNTLEDVSGLSEFDSLKRLNLCGTDLESLEAGVFPAILEQLILRDNYLNNVESISELTNLTYLDLGDNVDLLEVDLSNLDKLKTLKLSGNTICSFNDIKVSDKLEHLSLDGCEVYDFKGADKLNLRYLNVNSNYITSFEGLEDMNDLEVLHIQDNHVQELNPEELGCLESLRVLNLRNNFLGTTEGIEGLRNIESLYLDNNLLKDLCGVSGLKSLRYLSLKDNSLKRIGLSGLQNLKKLVLSNNRINQVKNSLYLNKGEEGRFNEVVEDTEKFLSSFSYISDVFSSELPPKDETVFERNMRMISLRKRSELADQFRKALKLEAITLQGLEHLEFLDVSGNYLGFVGFSDTYNVEDLRLDHNNLTELPLNLADNSFDSFVDHLNDDSPGPLTLLACFNKLKRLDLSHNQIKALGGLPVSLEELYVANNDIFHTSGLSNLINLRKLDLSSNAYEYGVKVSLENFDYELEEQFKCSPETATYFIDSIIDKFEPRALTVAEKFRKAVKKVGRLFSPSNEVWVEVAHSISGIEHLDNLQRLESLNLSDNNISEMDGLGYMENLKELDLSGNEITRVASLSNLPSLRKLDLSDNEILWPGRDFNLKNMDEINLSGNPKTGMTGGAFSVEIVKH